MSHNNNRIVAHWHINCLSLKYEMVEHLRPGPELVPRSRFRNGERIFVSHQRRLDLGPGHHTSITHSIHNPLGVGMILDVVA